MKSTTGQKVGHGYFLLFFALYLDATTFAPSVAWVGHATEIIASIMSLCLFWSAAKSDRIYLKILSILGIATIIILYVWIAIAIINFQRAYNFLPSPK